jgi:hypothetical protein
MIISLFLYGKMCVSVSGALHGLRPDHGRETLAVRWTFLVLLQVRELTFSRVGLRDKLFGKASDRLQVFGIKEAEAQFLHSYRLVGSVEKGVAVGPGCSASLFIAACCMVVPFTNSLHVSSSLLSLVLPTELANYFHCKWGALKQALNEPSVPDLSASAEQEINKELRDRLSTLSGATASGSPSLGQAPK